MPFIVSAGQKADKARMEVPPAGMHQARCIGLESYGYVKSDLFPETKPSPKMGIVWELLGITSSDGQPMTVRQTYTRSLHEKSKLRPVLESWRGKSFTDAELAAFDLEKVLGAHCSIMISTGKNKDGQEVYKVLAITPMQGEANAPSLMATYIWDCIEHGLHGEHWEMLPVWLRRDICIAQGTTLEELEDQKANAHAAPESLRNVSREPANGNGSKPISQEMQARMLEDSAKAIQEEAIRAGLSSAETDFDEDLPF